ncbi:diguanylate cyclase [Gudongella sp. DL1XJH-153]|uniref:diguanylate cyclase n=1 Tax=Gudongella sp. DL1XJH-153 TaxID=3409804 RepID=UPI003BB64490
MKQIHKRIRMIVLIVVAVVFLSIYIGIKEPISSSLEEGVLSDFQLTAHNKYQVLNEALINISNNARSLSSRTSIKNYMRDYLDGETTFEELRDYVIPRYEEGVAVFDRSRTAGRVLANGQIIHVVGPDRNIKNYIDWDVTEVMMNHYSQGVVVVQSPIMDGEDILGFDVVLTDISPIIRQMEAGGYDIDFLPGNQGDSIIRENGRVTSYIHSDFIGRTIAISMDEGDVLGPLMQFRRSLYLRYFLVLAVVFLIIQFLGVRFIQKFIREQQGLRSIAEENEKEKKTLIDEMNQGFILVRAANRDYEDFKDYEIIDVNNTFESMSSMPRDEIIGKSLYQLVSISNKLDTKEIDEVLESGESKQFEYHVKEMGRWWNLSVYRPRLSYLAIVLDDITDKKNIQLKLRDREETMRITLDVAGEGLWDWHFEEGVVRHNKKWCEIMGVPHDSDFHRIDQFVAQAHPEDEDKLRDNIARAMNGQENLYSEHRMLLQDGRTIWIRDRGTLLTDEKGKPVRMIGSMADITAQKNAEQELFLEKEIFQSTLLSVEDGIISTDVEGRITVLNPVAEEMTGWTFKEAQGKPLKDVFDLRNPESGDPEDILAVTRQTGNGNHRRALMVTGSGKEVILNNSIATVRLQNGQVMGHVIVFRDITESVRKQEKIEYLSFHDELTGLYNRRYIEDAIKRLDTSRNIPFTVMIVDMNNLKLTNDIFGHEMGDRIIREAAKLLNETLRADDIIARTGGDEFLILLPKTSAKEAGEIKERIQRNGHYHRVESLRLSLAVGFSTKTAEDESIDDNLRYADSNMYENKHRNNQDVKREIILDFLEENRKKFQDERQHNEETSLMAAALYRELGKSQVEVEEFKKAVELHDIGKIIVSEEILNKEEALTNEEKTIIRRHSQAGYEILRILGHHERYAKAIRFHHERYDGKGYPEGLMGEEIPLEARIISIADAYQSMTSHRPYKKAMKAQDAIRELRENAGAQFDEDLVEIFITKVIPNL